nr:lysophospholipid acyltransferase family protein [Desulfobulbaceae bacterium]
MDVKNFRQKLLFAVVPRLYALLTRVLFSTYRVDTEGGEHYEQLFTSGKPFIGVIWHYSVFFTMSFMKGKNWVAMVSTSNDAEYISRFLNSYGVTTVRGSSNKGGVAALRGLLTQMKRSGKNAAIVADGSQGPALKAQPGAVLAASLTQAPILPFIWSAQSYWSVNSWDKTVLPKPFSRIKVIYGEPITIPPKLSSEEIGKRTLALEKRLVALYSKAWAEFGRKTHG